MYVHRACEERGKQLSDNELVVLHKVCALPVSELLRHDRRGLGEGVSARPCRSVFETPSEG